MNNAGVHISEPGVFLLWAVQWGEWHPAAEVQAGDWASERSSHRNGCPFSARMNTAMDNTCAQQYLATPGHLLAETQPLSPPCKKMYWAVGECEDTIAEMTMDSPWFIWKVRTSHLTCGASLSGKGHLWQTAHRLPWPSLAGSSLWPGSLPASEAPTHVQGLLPSA